MKKDFVELIGVVVKINGKRKIIPLKNCFFDGWEYTNDDLYEYERGLDLTVRYGKKRHKISVY
jgi:hypothetical protein